MSAFNPDAFLDATTTEANSTQRLPVPEGEYVGIVKEVKPGTWQSKDGSKSGGKIDIIWTIDDQTAREKLGMAEVTCRQTVMLDLTEAGTLDMSKGKNVGLGRLREATGFNQPGKPFSVRQLVGATARVFVSHRPGDDGAVYDEIKKVAPL